MMTIDRAREIVVAILGRAFVTMDLPGDLSSLTGVSLLDMIHAKEIVEQHNKDAAAAAKLNGGSYSISVVPDDRLIAAVYVLEHYPHSDDAILAVPVKSFLGNVKAVAVQVVEVQKDEECVCEECVRDD